MPVRCVAFDADDTLWDFTAVMEEAIDLAIGVARDRRPEVAERLRRVDLTACWDRLHDDLIGGRLPSVRLDELRPRSFAAALAELGVDDPALVEAMTATYFAHRHGQIALLEGAVDLLGILVERYVLGLVTNGNTDPERGPLAGRFAFRLAADSVGVRKPDRRLFAMAAVAADCHPAELVYVGDHPHLDVAAAQAAGCRGVWLNRTGATAPPGLEPDATISRLAELPAVLARFDDEELLALGAVGVGPHPRPWPDDARLDPALLAGGDRRNVVDRYRYWHEGAIVDDLDGRRHGFHVAIENWRHDRNIGTVVRNANAFAAAEVHIVGRRRWNRRGAMATDRYLHVRHHDTVEDLVRWAREGGLAIVGIDNVAGSVPLEVVDLPERCVLLFGQEGPGLSPEAIAASEVVCSIAQFGSTRSVNAGVASGIAMHAWVRGHAPDPDRPGA